MSFKDVKMKEGGGMMSGKSHVRMLYLKYAEGIAWGNMGTRKVCVSVEKWAWSSWLKINTYLLSIFTLLMKSKIRECNILWVYCKEWLKCFRVGKLKQLIIKNVLKTGPLYTIKGSFPLKMQDVRKRKLLSTFSILVFFI